MPFKSLMLYINERVREDKIKESQNNYNSDMYFVICQHIMKLANGKPSKELKAWSEIIKKANGEIKEDKRTAKEIEEDTLKLFRK